MSVTTVGGEFRRGWLIVLTAAMGLACGLSALPIYTLGVFTKPLATEFAWSRAETQGIYTCFTVGNLVAAPLLGLLIDRQGVRRVALLSLVAVGAGFSAFGAFGGSLLSFYLIAFFTAVLGVGTVPITWTRVIVCWFMVGRGRALGVALAGTGVSATLLPSYATWLLENYGWRVAYFGIGALPLVLALPLALAFLRDRPPEVSAQSGQRSEGVTTAEDGLPLGTILKGYRFWVLLLAFVFVGFGTAGLLAHLVPMLTDRGITPSAAARMAGLVGICVIAGRIVTGYLLDKFWAPGVAAVVLNLPILACLLLIYGDVQGSLGFVAAACIGLTAGAEFDLMAYLVSRYFGALRFATTYSCLYALFKIAAGLAAPLFGFSFDSTGSYSLALIAGMACFLGASALMLTLGRYPAA